MNTMSDINIPICERYMLTVEEAAVYFHIGEKKLRRMAEDCPSANWVIMNGNRLLIKRKLLENTLDSQDAI